MADNTPNLGGMPTDGAHRDCIHVAVIPVVAGSHLYPCDRVERRDDGMFYLSEEGIGIVDPFLHDGIEPGDRFWLLLHPGTITSMRHVWTHPAFQSTPPRVGT